jgi:chromosome partitioning protein
MQFVDHLWELIVENFGRGIAVILVPVLGAVAWVTFRYLMRLVRQSWCFFQSRQRALRAVGREFTKDGPREGQGVWLTAPIQQPDDYASRVAASRILAIANLKGGVGKTTLAANIGAFFAKEWHKRVLLVDLDFQGSLSSMAFPDGEWIPNSGQNSIAAKLISNDITPDLVDAVAREVPLSGESSSTGHLKIITAYYDLAQADNRVLVEWLLECRCKSPKTLRESLIELLGHKPLKVRDVRYTLAEILHSNAVRSAFDLVIIDCPPRLTTSEVQAFCACSHLLIPTIFDRTSAEAVASLCGQVETLKTANVCPNLKYVGVAGTMWRGDRLAQRQAKKMVEDALRDAKIGAQILPDDTFIPHAAALVNDADQGIAYLNMPDRQDRQSARDVFERLATCVAQRMGLPHPPNVRAAA